MIGLETSGTAIDEYSLVDGFGMEALALLEHYQGTSDRDCCDERYKSCYETEDDIHDDEPYNRAAGCGCRPVDVAALQSHQFKRPLKPLEHGIRLVAVFVALFRHGSDAEEERQSLGSGHEEDAGTDNHHD